MSKQKDSQLSEKLIKTTKLALVVLVLSLFGLFVYFFQPTWFKINFNKEAPPLVQKNEAASTSVPITCSNCVPRLLDGELVAPDLAKLRPYAVMIDNFPSARPQSNLSAASLVYEAPAEGGVTRYLAFFAADKNISEIGPVRSARAYFLNWAKELGATYIHVGGSPEALEMAKDLGESDLNEFYKGSYFWRSEIKSAPHNVFISSDSVNKYRRDSGESGAELQSWLYKSSATSSPLVSQIKIKYGTAYEVSWSYEAKENVYERYLDNAKHLDAQANKIIAKNVIVQVVSFKVSDEKLRLELSSARSGQALLCQDGDCKLGVWKKNKETDRTRYYYKNGDEFIFNRGITWIEVIDSLKILEY